jgi:hypothetical protein
MVVKVIAGVAPILVDPGTGADPPAGNRTTNPFGPAIIGVSAALVRVGRSSWSGERADATVR